MKKTMTSSGTTILLLLMLAPTIVLGQSLDEACRTFVDRVFSQLGTNCAGLGTNEICYGYGDIQSTFSVDGQELISAEEYGQLTEIGDQSSLIFPDDMATIENVIGAAVVLPERANEDGEWSIALANIQANLPAQVDSMGANLLLLGDATIENAVSPEDAFILADIVEVVVDEASLYNKPPNYTFDGYESEIVDTVSGEFEVDAISSDGDWVRVFYVYETVYGERATAWLQTGELINEADLSVLPILDADDFAPMQSLYLDNDLDLPECETIVTNGLLIQGPENVETDIMVNGIPLRISSTVFVKKIEARLLRLSVLAGVVQIFPGTDDEIIIVAGEEVSLPLTEVLDLGIDGQEDDQEYDANGSIIGPFVFGTAGSTINSSILARFQIFNDLPDNLTNYSIPVIRIVQASGVGGPEITIIISPPEYAQRIQELCDADIIPSLICDFLQ